MKMLFVLAALACATAQAETLVVESNRADQNSLLAFHLNHDGTLTAQPEIRLNGKGFVDASLALGPYDSDQQILVNEDHTLLFAVNPGSNSISVYCILASGKLMEVKGSPFDSHGVQPVSVGLNRDILTVVNKHEDPAQMADTTKPNYTSFKVMKSGELKWIMGSTIEVEQGTSPSQALIAKERPFVFGADFLGGKLQSFQLTRAGALKQNMPMSLPDSEFPRDGGATPHAPLGLAAHPSKRLIYVGLPTVNKIAVYSYNSVGNLKFEKTIADSGTAVCWLTVNAAGTRLYASNTASPSITVYDLRDPVTPKEIQSVKVDSVGGAYQLGLSMNGSKLAVVTQRYQAMTPQGQGNEIHVYKVNHKGMLAPASKTVLNLPVDVRPEGLSFY